MQRTLIDLGIMITIVVVVALATIVFGNPQTMGDLKW